MANNTITIELCPEDRVMITHLIELLTRKCDACVQDVIKATSVRQESAQPAVAADKPDDETPAPWEDAAVAAPSAMTYTMTDVQAIVRRLITPGSTKREAAKQIVNDYGTNISGIPAERYTEVIERLKKLEAEA